MNESVYEGGPVNVTSVAATVPLTAGAQMARTT